MAERCRCIFRSPKKIQIRDTGILRVNAPNTDHNLIDKGVGGQRSTVQHTSHRLGVWLGGESSEDSMTRLELSLRKKRDITDTFQATLDGCLGLNRGDVQVKEGHC